MPQIRSSSRFTELRRSALTDESRTRSVAEIATQRLEILRNFPLLVLNQVVQDLATHFLARSSLPPKAKMDAMHIAAATIHVWIIC
jgi:hypothetical protein